MLKSILKNNKGVTLLEVTVAVAIFSVVMLSATEIFRMVIESQRNAIASQNIQENIRYAFEAMGKEIRTATISNYDCESLFSPPATAINKVYNTTVNSGGDILYFKNKDGICTAYYLEGEVLKVIRGENTASITPAKLSVSNLEFKVVDDLIGDFHSRQPRVTMKVDITAVGKEMHKQTMEMQTTISSRYYE
ncbi:MAG: prepilin-type N-terminal cleavage/methylation domain-containing protein [Patescibacteria group bacterium]|nr:prepilin-type N-terminal cleavage/methylation domain-containing protein [Patescibacteria group bacterium]